MNLQITGQNVGYVRVSTVLQNTSRQEEVLNGYNLDAMFKDFASGKNAERPELQAALKHVRKGDTLIIHSMDRLARNLNDLRSIVQDLTDREVKVIFIKENLTFTGNDSSISNLLLSVMGAFAEFERSLIMERQIEGIQLAKLRGAFKGRKRVLTEDQLISLKNKDTTSNGKNRSQLAREFGISRQTLYNYLNA
jgi:DNA invertase Pin-like site-specific DNA recombinase